jgi:hypothetical protein
VSGTGARVTIGKSLLVAGGDAFRLDLGRAYQGRANLVCSLAEVTVAARSAAFHLRDVPDAGIPVEPAIVQTKDCAFMNPFPGAKAGVLAYEGAALEHGLLLWQGQGDGFHRNLYFRASQVGGVSDKPQPQTAWSSLWGSYGDRASQVDLLIGKGFDSTRWDAQLDRLAFHAGRGAPGANLTSLGIKNKR